MAMINRQNLLNRILATDSAVLQYDSMTGDLKIWPWYVEDSDSERAY